MEINVENIIHDDNPQIRKHSADVALPLAAEDEELLRAMHQYVVDSQDPQLAKEKNLQPAVGIAAIQLGVPKKMIAVVVPDDSEEADEDEPGKNIEYALVNPKIISRSKEMKALSGGEGCLSVPGAHEGYVFRPARIRVKAYDLLSGKDVLIKADGYLAIVLQHEIDHLSGKLFYDHITKDDPYFIPENAEVLE